MSRQQVLLSIAGRWRLQNVLRHSSQSEQYKRRRRRRRLLKREQQGKQREHQVTVSLAHHHFASKQHASGTKAAKSKVQPVQAVVFVQARPERRQRRFFECAQLERYCRQVASIVDQWLLVV